MKGIILLIMLLPMTTFASTEFLGISKNDLGIAVVCVTLAILMRSTKEKK